MSRKQTTLRCQICGHAFSPREGLHADLVRESIATLAQQERGSWDAAGFICWADLHRYRALFLQRLMTQEDGEVEVRDRQVLQSLEAHEALVSRLAELPEQRPSLGGRLADQVASFGGSWLFIGSFLGLMTLWMMLNVGHLIWRPFDPYPFILLNLVLSCVAALQAPVIMMSQNRQDSKDRLRAEYDYKVNLKAEVEIRVLNETVGRLLTHQWHRLLEIQQMQLEILEELTQRRLGA